MDGVVMCAPSTVYLLDGLQTQIDGMLGDLPAVFGSFLDPKPKVDAD
jgi:hypothetical protein